MNEYILMRRVGPPPKSRWLTVILTIIFGSIITFLALRFWPQFIFIAKTLLFTVVLCSVPTLSNSLVGKWGEFVEAIVQSALATVIVLVFSLWFLGSVSIGIWLLILFILLLVSLIGGYLIRLIQTKIIKRLQNSENLSFSKMEIRRLKESAKHQILFYISIPFGLITATVIGFVRGLSDLETLRLVPVLMLGGAGIILFISLVVSAVVMSKSLTLFDLRQANAQIRRHDRKEGFLNKVIALLNSKHENEIPIGQKYSSFLDMAYLVADLRKVYFYDSVHCTILMLGFSVALITMFKAQVVSENIALITFIGLLCLVLFCYLPDSIGQSRLHETILDSVSLEGAKRKELKGKLSELSPVSPKLEFLGALIATGGAGGLIGTLAVELLKSALK